MTKSNSAIKTIIFDLGGVLIDWNPEYLFLDVFNNDREKTNWFLNNICTSHWNECQDAGRTIREGTLEKINQFPEYKTQIELYYNEWEKMLGGEIKESVEILKKLLDKMEFQIVALTNWSAETFPIALKRFEFLSWFEDILVSGKEKTRKPFPEIYEMAIKRFGLIPEKSIFIDDNYRNILAAQNMGIKGIHFTSASELKKQLREFNIIIHD